MTKQNKNKWQGWNIIGKTDRHSDHVNLNMKYYEYLQSKMWHNWYD